MSDMVHSRKEGLVHSGLTASIPGGDEAGGAGRFTAPIWRTRNGRLRQESAPLGRKQALLLLRWADEDRGPDVQPGPVGFEPARGGKPWPDMRPLIDRGLMWAKVYQPSDWREGEWRLGWKRWEAGLTPLGQRVVDGILGGMTLRQFSLARSALGLTDDNTIAYQNDLGDRYPTQATRDARRREQLAMVEAGFAERRDVPASDWFSAGEAFTLTEAGALLALLPGETFSSSLTISKAVGDVKRDADPIHRRDGDAASGAVNQASLPSQSEVG